MSYKVGTIINRNYTYNGNLYIAKITFKRMRNIVLRLGKEENALRLSAPYYSSMERIDKMVSEFLPKLIKRSKKVDAALPYGDGWVYILGEKIEAEFEDEKEREMYLKKRLLKLVEERVRSPTPGRPIPYASPACSSITQSRLLIRWWCTNWPIIMCSTIARNSIMWC